MGKALSGSSAWRERVGLGHGWDEGAKLEVVQSSAAQRSHLLGREGARLCPEATNSALTVLKLG